ncbi:hydantoinase/oxoprolinase family protein [Baekduia soli]|uniref:Hydantoinase/oxoprolinase family protein n=1 Tax=Baekduia soli TaxID=496014 RepID=A0A5B8U069_9ACTN|nr:hydantoinase/oxoprolinase family protein [Baekduia soli]QEC46362.1 hydantoinase/oxoprolinase family protein [Baekduia soli]
MSFRIAVDTGGTFTDVVVADDAGVLTVNKALTDQDRVFSGIREALEVTGSGYGTDAVGLLNETDLFIYATTRATNAVIEGRTARTAFLTTKGFPDTLVLREGGKFNAYDFATSFPEPYIPRRLTFEIDERVDSEGQVVTALDETQAREVLRRLGRLDVEAVAVCLLWSTSNAVHERRLGELMAEEIPEIPFTLSHELNPIVREYRRASSAALDASLKPLMQGHLNGLETDLRANGFRGELLAATSFGGVTHVEDMVKRPICSVRSGPAMAPVAGRTYGGAEGRIDNIIVCDTGGTSFDVSLVRDGQIKFTRETWLGKQFTGHLTGLSSVDARSIGAGGGSIAWVDPGGLLRVGPHSAGSRPGPACYGRGGKQPTVTDAALIAGYLNPDNFLGGRMHLDVEAARAALQPVAERLGQNVEDCVQAVLTIANEHMVQAIQEITVNEGVDPRESLVVAGGGAGGLNIVPIVAELGCREVLVPRTAGGLSACGAQYSDVVTEFSASLFTESSSFAFDGVNAVLAGLDRRIDGFVDGLRERGMTAFHREYFAEARYAYQVWELEVPLPSGRFDDVSDLDALVAGMHDAHERVFAVRDEHSAVEVLFWRARVTATLDRPVVEAAGAGAAEATDAARGSRRALFKDGALETAIFDGPSLQPGAVIRGPAVIEEPTTTIVVYPEATARVTATKNYLLEVS